MEILMITGKDLHGVSCKCNMYSVLPLYTWSEGLSSVGLTQFASSRLFLPFTLWSFMLSHHEISQYLLFPHPP